MIDLSMMINDEIFHMNNSDVMRNRCKSPSHLQNVRNIELIRSSLSLANSFLQFHLNST